MIQVGELEIRTQRRVVDHFRDQLGYRYLGNWHERQGNRNIEADYLMRFLAGQGHDPDIISKAVEKLDKAAALGGGRTLYGANRDVYGLLRYGARIRPGLGEQTVTVDLIDWKDPAANGFAIAEEVTIEGNHTKRPDIVLYVNGIAVGVLELKRSTVSVAQGIRQNLDNQKKDFIQPFFTTVQLVMAGNDTEGAALRRDRDSGEVLAPLEGSRCRCPRNGRSHLSPASRARLTSATPDRLLELHPRLRGLRRRRQEDLPPQSVLTA